MDKQQPIKRLSDKRNTDFQDKPQSKIMQDTQQSSQQYIITDATFELIIKERDALIERLESEQKQLKQQLEQRKIELCDLSQTISQKRGSTSLIKLTHPSLQLSKIKPDTDGDVLK